MSSAPHNLQRRPWPPRPPRRRRGTTMVEVLVSLLIISLVSLTAMESLRATLKAVQWRDSQVRGRLLAEGLLAEALAMPYQDADDTSTVEFGIESDETSNPSDRSEFDDLDDYHGWSSQPERKDGTAMPDATGWKREVTVEQLRWDQWTSSGGEDGDEDEGGSGDEGLRRVTVTVTDPDGREFVAAGYRVRDGALQQPLAYEQEVVSGVAITLHTGNDVLDAGVAVLNHATGP